MDASAMLAGGRGGIALLIRDLNVLIMRVCARLTVDLYVNYGSNSKKHRVIQKLCISLIQPFASNPAQINLPPKPQPPSIVAVTQFVTTPLWPGS
jgi:hypothetical protein